MMQSKRFVSCCQNSTQCVIQRYRQSLHPKTDDMRCYVSKCLEVTRVMNKEERNRFLFDNCRRYGQSSVRTHAWKTHLGDSVCNKGWEFLYGFGTGRISSASTVLIDNPVAVNGNHKPYTDETLFGYTFDEMRKIFEETLALDYSK